MVVGEVGGGELARVLIMSKVTGNRFSVIIMLPVAASAEPMRVEVT